jgi:hypothetical protein
MQELEITWGRVASVWWLLAWRTLVGAMLLGAAFGFLIGFVGALAGLPQDKITTLSSIVGGIIGLVWGFVVVRMALKKQYSDFRLVLVPR